jgi:hypothetical protein
MRQGEQVIHGEYGISVIAPTGGTRPDKTDSERDRERLANRVTRTQWLKESGWTQTELEFAQAFGGFPIGSETYTHTDPPRCLQPFRLTPGGIAHYVRKQLALPRRCQSCRDNRRIERESTAQ